MFLYFFAKDSKRYKRPFPKARKVVFTIANASV